MKTAGVVENSGHCMYSIGSRCFLNCLSLFHVVFYIYIYIHSSYDERTQRRQSAQYRKRRAITVKVTLAAARCDSVSHTPMTTMIFRQV